MDSEFDLKNKKWSFSYILKLKFVVFLSDQISWLQDHHHAHHTLNNTHHFPILSLYTWAPSSGSLLISLHTSKSSFESYLQCPFDISSQWGNIDPLNNYSDSSQSKLSQNFKNYLNLSLSHIIHWKVSLDWITKCCIHRHTLWKNKEYCFNLEVDSMQDSESETHVHLNKILFHKWYLKHI